MKVTLGVAWSRVFTEETLPTVKGDAVCSVDDVCNHAAILWRQKSFGRQHQGSRLHHPGLKEAGLGISKDLNGRYEFVSDTHHDAVFGRDLLDLDVEDLILRFWGLDPQ